MNFVLYNAQEFGPGRWKAPRTGSLERLPYNYCGLGARVLVGLVCLMALCQGQASADCAEAETNLASAAMNDTNAQETLRAYLQLQEQLHLTQLAVEQNRKEARETAAQNSELLAGRLQTIEKALESQRARELEAMQSSNRAMLLVAGSFAAVGFVAMLLMSFFQWRTVNRLAEISATLPATLALGSPARPGLVPADSHVVTVGPAEQSTMRLLGALEQLEKRIYEMEHTSRTPLHEGGATGNGFRPSHSEPGGHGITPAGPQHEASAGTSVAGEAERVSLLLGKGQSMLNLDDPKAAIACFEEVLAIERNNAEAWVRKGTALERLQQLNEAAECYDRAIAVNGSMTIAYLHKGGLFNRMERFNEALECYEKALRTQEKRHA
jgi:tetratricopeptide (TPR) repeat protein